jgi:hypothetical protein
MSTLSDGFAVHFETKLDGFPAIIAPPVRAYIANTDYDWYEFFLAGPEIDEVNFWRAAALTSRRPARLRHALPASHVRRLGCLW